MFSLKLWALLLRGFLISCWSLNVGNTVPGLNPNAPSSKNYEGGFSAELMMKDIQIALKSAKEKGLDLKLLEDTESIYKHVIQSGFGKKDFSFAFQDRNKK